jgi:hypothetical protein
MYLRQTSHETDDKMHSHSERTTVSKENNTADTPEQILTDGIVNTRKERQLSTNRKKMDCEK